MAGARSAGTTISFHPLFLPRRSCSPVARYKTECLPELVRFDRLWGHIEKDASQPGSSDFVFTAQCSKLRENVALFAGPPFALLDFV